MTITTWEVKEPYLSIPCKLGEGPFYNAERHELRFLDINNSKLYIIDLNKGPQSLHTIDTGMPIGVTADIEGLDSAEVILTGAKDGVTKFDLKTGKHEYIAKYWPSNDKQDRPRRMRSNDGGVDSKGRFWVGVFTDPEIEEPTDDGVVFRLDLDRKVDLVYEKIVIPNSISWTSDNKISYLVDTIGRKIYAFDFNESTGAISNKRIHYDHRGNGNPDGHALDVEGNIWQALYGGSKVIRISPTGEVTGEVHLPTRNVTCPTFVGTELFITTAAEGNAEDFPESAKFAGNLFKIDVGVEGAPKYRAHLA